MYQCTFNLFTEPRIFELKLKIGIHICSSEINSPKINKKKKKKTRIPSNTLPRYY